MEYAYLRQVPQFAPLLEQQKAILAFATAHHLTIKHEVVEYASKKSLLDERKQFLSFLQTICKGDGLVIYSLSVISDNPEEIIKVINCILSHEAILYVCDRELKIDENTKIAEVLPLLSHLSIDDKRKRTKKGRPKGSRSSSKFDDAPGYGYRHSLQESSQNQ